MHRVKKVLWVYSNVLSWRPRYNRCDPYTAKTSSASELNIHLSRVLFALLSYLSSSYPVLVILSAFTHWQWLQGQTFTFLFIFSFSLFFPALSSPILTFLEVLTRRLLKQCCVDFLHSFSLKWILFQSASLDKWDTFLRAETNWPHRIAQCLWVHIFMTSLELGCVCECDCVKKERYNRWKVQ